MSNAYQIKEYIRYTSHPFTSQQIVGELGICYETVKKYLQELITEDYIKKIGKDKGKNVYVMNKNRERNTNYRVNQKQYTLNDVHEAYRRQIQKLRERFDDLL